jgi:cell wall-associated NlpC family hydrolase
MADGIDEPAWAPRRHAASAIRACGMALLVSALCAPPASAVDDETIPSRQQVRSAQADVASTAAAVGRIRSELADAQQELSEVMISAAQAAEEYNGARYRLQRARAAARQAEHRADNAARKVRRQWRQLESFVVTSATDTTAMDRLDAVLSAGGPEQLLRQLGSWSSTSTALQINVDSWTATKTVAGVMRDAADVWVRRRGAAAKAAATAHAAAERALRRAEIRQDALEDRTDRLVARLADAQSISVSLARQRQRGLAVRAAEQAAGSQLGTENGLSATAAQAGGTDVAPTGAAATAIAFARHQLGEPYEWAAAGPGSWDCSGLTMGAWAAAGVALPHYSVAQYQATTPVGLGSLRPGDLLFWGNNKSPDSIYHVAMYLGDGLMIHAPRTGRNVEIQSMYYWIPPTHFSRV